MLETWNPGENMILRSADPIMVPEGVGYFRALKTRVSDQGPIYVTQI